MLGQTRFGSIHTGEITMTSIRFILAIAILLFAAYVVVMNWGCVIVSRRNKRRRIDQHHSTIPIVSLILAALAYLLYPRPDKIWRSPFPCSTLQTGACFYFQECCFAS